jgi:hypothetical protein
MNKEKGHPEGWPSSDRSLDLKSQGEQTGVKNQLQLYHADAGKSRAHLRGHQPDPVAPTAIPEPKKRKVKLKPPADWFPNDRGAFGVDHCCCFPRGGAWVVQIMRPELLPYFTRKRNQVGFSHPAFRFCEQFAFPNKTKWQMKRLLLEAIASLPEYREEMTGGAA